MFVDVGKGIDGKHRIINADHIQSMTVEMEPNGLLLSMTGGHEIYLGADQSERLRQAIADYHRPYGHFRPNPKAPGEVYVDPDLFGVQIKELGEKFG